MGDSYPGHNHDPNYCDDVPDRDDLDYYESLTDDEDEGYSDCGMDRHGNCGKAGSEECDWECPYGRSTKN